MKRLLLLLSLISMRHVNGQGYVTIPDTNLCAYLQSIIPTAMSGNQLDTTNTLVTTTTHSINVSGKNIANLSGVQYFSSLTYLACSLCPLTSLPMLPNALKYLNCSNNRFLASLPTLPNSLTYLNCSASWYGNNNMNNCGACFTCNPPPMGNLNCLPILPSSLDTLICCYNHITCFPTFPNSLVYVSLNNPFYCLPNYVLPAMNSYTATPLCTTSNPYGCAISANGNACGVAGISQISHIIQISLYPNPTSDQFFIETNTTDKLNVDLFDVNGRHVFNASVSDKENINISTLDNGAYTLTIKTSDHAINKKLVILH